MKGYMLQRAGIFVRVIEEHSIFYMIVWLAPAVEATLEHTSERCK